jgi:hypothetical protein
VRACEPSEDITDGLPRKGSAVVPAMLLLIAARVVSAGGAPTGGNCANSGGAANGISAVESDTRAVNAQNLGATDMNRRRTFIFTKGLLLRKIDSAPRDR